jgi:hypothetical protein
MRVVFAILLTAALCGSSSSFAQTKTTGDAKSGGPCSPAVTGDNNTFYFKYCGSDPEEGKRIVRLLQAVAQGEVLTNAKLDEVLEILSMPVTITWNPIAVVAPRAGHPRAAVKFHSDDPVDRGQFEVSCDRACTPVQFCPLMGSNAGALATVSDRANIAEFLFQRQFPALKDCVLTVESRDDEAVKIVGITTSRRTSNLVWNEVQPTPSVITGRSVFQ